MQIALVWSDAHRGHVPGGEVWIGRPLDGDETPDRVERIRAVLTGAGARVVAAGEHAIEHVLAVHDESLVAFLRAAWDGWVAAGYPEDPGQERVVSYVYPHPGLMGSLRPLVPASTAALTGLYTYDTMTPIGPGTWEAARGAADAALTGCDLVLAGASLAYACTRPPGHHVTRSAFGGSCYLNNAAIAAQYLRDRGAGRVAVVDVDAHHGNGAQSIFWERDDVLTTSVHVDPEAGWFPHFLGTAAERGAGVGEGANLNLVLAPGTTDDAWLAAVERACAFAREGGAEAMVVALGVDAARGDPNSPLLVTEQGYRAAGVALGRLGLPTVVVQEGGYDLATIGELVLATLSGLEEGSNGA